MKRTYEVRDRADKRAIREFLKREGQFLLPMLELVEQTEVAIDEVIQVMGRATIEAVLEMSAEGVAGVKQAGRSRAEDDTVWYGRQGGVVYLLDRRVRVERPRLRRRGAGEGGEVEVPAYAAMRRPGAVADRMLEVLMAGVSTRKYGRVIGEMADTVGVSKSAVSRETVEASERVLKELMERRLDAWDLLVIYLDGIQMGSHHVLAAVGVDSDGKKHVLGVREGASENAEVTSALLEDLVERGLDPGRRRLFVIDGSKALRKAIEKVFRSDSDAISWLERLHGHIWVLRGNHDSERELDEAVSVGAIEGWAHVKYLRHNSKKFWLSHYPHRSWQGSNRSENSTFHLFGHSHGDLTVPRGRLMDVGVDAVARWLATRRDPEANRTTIPFDGVRQEDYRPIGFDEVVGWLEGEPPTNQHGQGSGSP